MSFVTLHSQTHCALSFLEYIFSRALRFQSLVRKFSKTIKKCERKFKSLVTSLFCSFEMYISAMAIPCKLISILLLYECPLKKQQKKIEISYLITKADNPSKEVCEGLQANKKKISFKSKFFHSTEYSSAGKTNFVRCLIVNIYFYFSFPYYFFYFILFKKKVMQCTCDFQCIQGTQLVNYAEVH